MSEAEVVGGMGFGTGSVEEVIEWALDRFWERNPPLPLAKNHAMDDLETPAEADHEDPNRLP